jgi:hypothetical protein
MVCLIYNRCVCGSCMETLLRLLRVIVDHDFQTLGLQEHAALNVLVMVIFWQNDEVPLTMAPHLSRLSWVTAKICLGDSQAF